MANKTNRFSIIRKLLSSEVICSQEELIYKLKESGVEVTQSTLSRDLKFLKVAKVPHKVKGYHYMLPGNMQNEPKEEKGSRNISDNILSIDFSGNIAVIKTVAGYANAITVLIDERNFYEILGTIAGEDTIFIVMREGVSSVDLINALAFVHPGIHTL